MLTKIEIENFKSIYKETIELGRVNVFIGENGCGKTNILEAVGMASALAERKLSNDELALKGIRVTKPSITLSSFKGRKQKNSIIISCKDSSGAMEENLIPIVLFTKNKSDIYSSWNDVHELLSDDDFFKSLLESNEENDKELISSVIKNTKNRPFDFFSKFTPSLFGYKIFNLSTRVLRGVESVSREIPGLFGENLDLLILNFDKDELELLVEHSHFISWLDNIVIDREDRLRLEGHKLDMSKSILYFKDKFMEKKNNIFSAENANEGILHILFYLALFISKRTPKFFAIDNIETALNPYLCTVLMEKLIKLAEKNDKQVLITTHNPAILDGLNLHDDKVRLFVVERDFKGHTRVERKKLKPDVELNGRRLKLSELWMRGYLGAIPQHF